MTDMNQTRTIRNILKSKPTMEGAGVRLKRVFGFHEVPTLDPFLLLDAFGSDNPQHYIQGFPWHPHRGIETITYVLHGNVEHGDSMGNKGTIGSGDVQWMTAGSGIIHQEMPKGDEKGRMYGFQLWANLPAAHKMMNPRYQEIKSEGIPELVLDDGTRIRIICGAVGDQKGPVQDIVIDPQYLDITVPAKSAYRHPTKMGHTVFAYLFEGDGFFDPERDRLIEGDSLIVFDDGDHVAVSTGDQPVRFLLISGRPIGEPVAWYGPIVMNTQEELQLAFQEYRNGTFIKHDAE
jgi:redox-sensitive bicupin YhaK (pirin superfamily)